MSEENNNQNGDIEEQQEAAETTPEEAATEPARRRYFTRRNAGIGAGGLAILAVLFAILLVVSYRYGVFDNYVKTQFVNKMAEIGVVFDADVFRVTVSPLELELKNATFTDKVSGDKLFFIREGHIGLTVQNLYAWQLSRDIKVDSTDITGAEVWVKFDENGKSNFSNLQFVEDKQGSRVNFKYDSIKFSLKEGLIHFGDVQHKISADAKNVAFLLEPTTYAVPDEQKRYNFDVTSADSVFVYDEKPVEPIDVRAKGIADNTGAEISEFKLTTPIGESTLNGRLTDWKNLQYDLNISSTVDLTQTSNILPLGTPLRGIANFAGKVTGAGDSYKVEGKIDSEALSAYGIYLKALNVAATVEGTNSMYEANGKAIAELLTFEDFKIDFPQLIGNVRGTGTDFRWVGELQAAAAKAPFGTIGGLFISDAVAEYKDKQFSANFGNTRARTFTIDKTEFENLQAGNLKLSSSGGMTDVTAPSVRASKFKLNNIELQNVTGRNLKVKDRPKDTSVTLDNLQANNGQIDKTKLKNLSADDFRLRTEKGTTDITAKNFRSDRVEASGALIANLNASDVTIRDTPADTVIFSNNVQIAKLETDAATLGTLNVGGVRLTIRRGVIEGSSGDVNAGNVVLTKNKNLPEGGNLENVKIYKPVFVLEPSGRYRASADMSLGGGTIGSIKLGAATANVVASNEQVALNNLKADVMDGQLNGAATIAFNNRSRSNINAVFSNLDLGKLLALQGGRVVPIEGQTTGQVNLTFAGTNFKTASGNLTADIVANAGTQDKGLIPVTGRVEATATNGLFNLDLARLNTEKSELNATGRLDLNGYDSNLNVSLASTDAGEITRIVKVLEISPSLEQQIDSYQAEFAGNLQFKGTLTGNVSDPSIDGHASVDTIALRGRTLGSVALDVAVSPAGTELKNGILQEPNGGGNLAFDVNIPTGGADNISVQATLNKINTGNLLAALPVGTFPDQFKDFQAQTSGTINLTGLPKNMQGEANISSTAGTINGQPFDGFDAKATFAGTLVNLENFNVRFGNGYLRANGTYSTDTTAFDLNIESKDVEFARVRPFIPKNQNLPNINGVIDLQAKATGIVDDSRTYNINFSGTGRNVVYNESGIGVVTFVGKTENEQLNANLTVNFENQPQTIMATVNFADENLPFRAETTFNNTELAPFIALVRPATGENDVAVSGRATGTIFIAGNLSSLDDTGKRVFTTDNLSGSAEFSQLALQIGDTPLTATEAVSVRFNSKEVVFDSARFNGGGSNMVVSGTKALTDDGINNLTVNGTINLRILNALSPNTFFSGLTQVDIRLTGPNKTARLNGEAIAQNASISTFVGSERLTFERVKGRVLFTSNQAQIDELTGFLGGGRVSITGGAQLNDSLQLQAFRFGLNGSNITVPLPKNFITTGDAEVEINGRRIGSDLTTRISGKINARRSLYTEDIDLADIIGGRSEGSLEQGGGASIFGTTQLDLLIEGRDALVVRNNLADLTASLSLRVTGEVDYPQISGRVTANAGGTILFRKERYEVQRGVLEFPPNATGIEPIINLQAESEINGYQVFVNLSGNLADTESLNASVRSNPALPQADVVSLITTGSLSNNEGGIPTLAQSGINTATEILADEIINKPLSKATDKLFGLNRFEIDPIISGQRLNPTARLTVGRQINRNLLITYSTNLSEDQNQVLALEYRVSNRLSFVAQYEQRSLSNVTRNNNVFSFEVRLRKRF
ncbi:MAG TPA: YdbH domain-containing protein [Pyrinomonadaceae bacterium]|jgi:translocation and assembly module TamB